MDLDDGEDEDDGDNMTVVVSPRAVQYHESSPLAAAQPRQQQQHVVQQQHYLDEDGAETMVITPRAVQFVAGGAASEAVTGEGNPYELHEPSIASPRAPVYADLSMAPPTEKDSAADVENPYGEVPRGIATGQVEIANSSESCVAEVAYLSGTLTQPISRAFLEAMEAEYGSLTPGGGDGAYGKMPGPPAHRTDTMESAELKGHGAVAHEGGHDYVGDDDDDDDDVTVVHSEVAKVYGVVPSFVDEMDTEETLVNRNHVVKRPQNLDSDDYMDMGEARELLANAAVQVTDEYGSAPPLAGAGEHYDVVDPKTPRTSSASVRTGGLAGLPPKPGPGSSPLAAAPPADVYDVVDPKTPRTTLSKPVSSNYDVVADNVLLDESKGQYGVAPPTIQIGTSHLPIKRNLPVGTGKTPSPASTGGFKRATPSFKAGSPSLSQQRSKSKRLSSHRLSVSDREALELQEKKRVITEFRKKEKQKLLFCVKELFATEKTYKQSLSTILELFLLPLRGLSCMPEPLHDLVFSNIESISSSHFSLSLRLESEKIEDLLEKDVYKAIVNVSKVFEQWMRDTVSDTRSGKAKTVNELYSIYCSSSNDGRAALNLERKVGMEQEKLAKASGKGVENESSLYQWLKAAEHKHRKRLGFDQLSSYLIRPVQRICKYPLLFKAIEKELQSQEKKEQNEEREIDPDAFKLEREDALQAIGSVKKLSEEIVNDVNTFAAEKEKEKQKEEEQRKLDRKTKGWKDRVGSVQGANPLYSQARQFVHQKGVEKQDKQNEIRGLARKQIKEETEKAKLALLRNLPSSSSDKKQAVLKEAPSVEARRQALFSKIQDQPSLSIPVISAPLSPRVSSPRARVGSPRVIHTPRGTGVRMCEECLGERASVSKVINGKQRYICLKCESDVLDTINVSNLGKSDSDVPIKLMENLAIKPSGSPSSPMISNPNSNSRSSTSVKVRATGAAVRPSTKSSPVAGVNHTPVKPKPNSSLANDKVDKATAAGPAASAMAQKSVFEHRPARAAPLPAWKVQREEKERREKERLAAEKDAREAKVNELRQQKAK